MRCSMVVFYFVLGGSYASPLLDIFKQDGNHYPSGEGNTPAEKEKSEYEIVHLSDHAHPIYNFNAFGRDIKLHLKPNKKIITDVFKTYVVDGHDKTEITEKTRPCYYLHADNFSTAAVNFCYKNKLHGVVFFETYVLEVSPADEQVPKSNKTIPIIVKKSLVEDIPWEDELSLLSPISSESEDNFISDIKADPKTSETKPILEAALFFDEAAFKIFAPYFNYDVVQLRDMLLAYINGVQALYHHPSIGRSIDIMLTRLEIFQRQPTKLPHYGGERESLLDSFCQYHSEENPEGDDDPHHWDIGLYVSGLDFFAVEKGKKSGVTMGLAVVGGVCLEKYSCIIAEFGVTNIFGKPYPSAGFTSIFVLAHEIGHSLGMHHDGYTNTCPKEGFIMSPSRGVFGETLWSRCSAEVMTSLSTWATCLYDEPEINNELDHRKFGDTPGLVWSLKKQCEILLKDKDAQVYESDNQEDVCQNVRCRTPHRSGFYFSGPAIEGTICGNNKWCKGGECVPFPENDQNDITLGQWSEWTIQHCQSGCIVNSKGYRSRKRTCNNPFPVNTNEGCEGLSYEVLLCNDEEICREKSREVADQYSSRKCREYSSIINEIDREGIGLQAPHEIEKPWMGCAIFCRRSDKSSFYTPRVELNDLGVDPYFPDGTWCHHDGIHNYYCLQHHCLPEDFRYSKNVPLEDDLQLPQNALPETIPLSEVIKNYLSTDNKGRPLLKSLNPNATYWNKEETAWETKDYIEIP